MQNLDNNNIEQLIIAFYIINYLNGDFNYKKILNTTNQANRFDILNLFESYFENSDNEEISNIYSKDKLTKAIQKSVLKRASNNLDFEKQNNIYNKMMIDIKNKIVNILGISDFILIDDSIPIESLIVSHIYNLKNEINFKTNDTKLFKEPINSNENSINIINTEKEYKNIENAIYYIPKLKYIHLNLINNSDFIIDLNENKHKINGIRIVKLSNFKIKESKFELNKICKLWSTLLYLGINTFTD